nr:hypothetical protein [Pedobacter sp. ASV2]
MGYAKERGKLEKLSENISGLELYNEKSLAILNDSYEKYSHSVRILKNKVPDLFGSLYENELQDIKKGRKLLKESETDELRQQNFLQYKSLVQLALEKTIQVTKDSQ